MSDGFRCEACGSGSAEALPYKVTTANGLPGRLVLKLGHMLLRPERLPRRLMAKARTFADGLFVLRRLLWCRTCGLGVLSPKPSKAELNRYYKMFYWNDSVSLPLPEGPRGQVQLDFLRDAVGFTSAERTLEFGAGPANPSRLLSQQGLAGHVTVVEMSNAYQDAYARMPEIIHRACRQFPEGEKFDLIMSSHSLEHVHDIGETLDQWRNALTPDGTVFIEVPCYTRASLDGHGSYHKPHTYFLTSESLSLLARAHGFAVASMETFGPPYEEFLAHRTIDDEQLRRRNSEGIWLRAALRPNEPATGDGRCSADADAGTSLAG